MSISLEKMKYTYDSTNQLKMGRFVVFPLDRQILCFALPCYIVLCFAFVAALVLPFIDAEERQSE